MGVRNPSLPIGVITTDLGKRVRSLVPRRIVKNVMASDCSKAFLCYICTGVGTVGGWGWGALAPSLSVEINIFGARLCKSVYGLKSEVVFAY